MRVLVFASACWSLVLALVVPSGGEAASLAWSRQPNHERLTVRFATGLPSLDVVRTSDKEITLRLPEDIWARETRPALIDLSPSRLVAAVRVEERSIVITLRRSDVEQMVYTMGREQAIVVELTRQPKTPPANATQSSENTTLGDKASANATHQMPAASAMDGPGNATAAQAIPPSPEQAPLGPGPQGNTSAQAVANATAIPYLDSQPPASAGPTTAPLPESTSAGSRLRAALNASLAVAPHAAAPQPFRIRSSVVASATPEQPAEVVALAPKTPEVAGPVPAADFGSGGAPSGEDGGIRGGPPSPGSGQVGEARPHELPPATAVDANATVSAPARSLPQDVPGTVSPNATAQLASPPSQSASPVSAPAAGGAQEAPRQMVPADQPAPAAGVTAAAPASAANATADNATDAAHEAELEALFQTVQDTLARGDLAGALDGLEGLRRHPRLPDRLREEVLYTLAELRMKEAKDDLAGHYLKVREAFLEALHFNPTSVRAPQALINLGYLNLSVGNEPEAEGYFELLRRKYPKDFNLPLIDYYWGEYFARRGQWSRAADHFQAVIQQYPDSQPVLPSAVGLVRALAELGFWAKAWEIVDFVEKRWPRFYIDDPEFLSLAGQIAMHNALLDAARERLWLYYNLLGTKGPSADMALARIGDIYLRQGKTQAAKTAYEKAAAEFPEREGGLISKMRLAEEGIVDAPTLESMAAIFDRPFSLRPEQIYTDIVTRFPDSPLAPVARLKLAMWYLWTGRFDEAIVQGRRFLADYQGHSLTPRAEETIFTALTRWMARDAEEENFRGLVTRFEANPDMAERILQSDRLRLALALAYLKLGQPQRTLELARPFFFGAIPQGEFSLPAFDLALAVLVDLGRFAEVVELAAQVKNWDLGEGRQRQLDYALALAFENLGRQEDALGLWTRLAIDVELPPTQRGHAVYFLARAAYAESEWERAYLAAQEALSLLLHKGSDLGKIRDTLAMLVDITEGTGRLEEALGWAMEYERFVQPNSPDWPRWIYRKAAIQRRLAREAEWRASLQAIIDTAPDSLYARMAKSELTDAAIFQRLNRLQ